MKLLIIAVLILVVALSVIFFRLVSLSPEISKEKQLDEENYLKDEQADRFIGDLALAPNDQLIVFNYQKNKESFLYLAKPDGSNIKKLSNSGNAEKPSFSTDGKKIAFIQREGDLKGKQDQIISNIKVADLDGNELKKLTLKGFNVHEVVFDKSGQNLIFLNSADNKIFGNSSIRRPINYDLFLVNIDGGNQTKITNRAQKYPLNILLLSSDGNKLIADDSDNSQLLYLSGEKFSNVSVGKKFYGLQGTISQDESYIATVEDQRNGFELHVYKNDQYLYRSGFESNISSPRIFSDNSKIIFLLQTNFQNTRRFDPFVKKAIPFFVLKQADLVNGRNLQDIQVSIP